MISRCLFLNFFAAIALFTACSRSSVPTLLSPDVKAESAQRVDQDRFKYGYPQYNLVREYDDYVVCYDPRTKNPYWTYEVLKKETLRGSASREAICFKEDATFPKVHRARLLDFKHSGYDRGHLVAAANNKYSRKSMEDTFLLTNISPMHPDVNRRLWKGLEEWIREQTIKKNSKTHVITGALFLPTHDDAGNLFVKYAVIGNNQVAIPTHFFKVILFETSEGKIEKKAFLIPNEPTDKRNSFWDFQVRLEKVEAVSGLLIFRSQPSTKPL